MFNLLEMDVSGSPVVSSVILLSRHQTNVLKGYVLKNMSIWSHCVGRTSVDGYFFKYFEIIKYITRGRVFSLYSYSLI